MSPELSEKRARAGALGGKAKAAKSHIENVSLSQDEIDHAHAQRVEMAEAFIFDYEEVLERTRGIVVSTCLINEIKKHPRSAEVAYFLASHPEIIEWLDCFISGHCVGSLLARSLVECVSRVMPKRRCRIKMGRSH